MTFWPSGKMSDKDKKKQVNKPYQTNDKDKKYAVNLLPMSVVHDAFKKLYGRRPNEDDLSTLRVDMQGENLIILVPHGADFRKTQPKKD